MLLPLKAVLMNLLSVAAAYGALGGDRAGRDPRPADPRAGHDGDHGPLELVAADAAARVLPNTDFERTPVRA
jgi:hypothetical protein